MLRLTSLLLLQFSQTRTVQISKNGSADYSEYSADACALFPSLMHDRSQISPIDGSAVATRELPTNEQLNAAIEKAATAQKSWVRYACCHSLLQADL